jgi:hypothetical protein
MNAKNVLAEKSILAPSDLDTMIKIANDDFAVPRHMAAGKNQEDAVFLNRRQVLVYERGSQFDLLFHVPQTFMWVSPMPRNVLTRNTLVQKRRCAEGIRFKHVDLS